MSWLEANDDVCAASKQMMTEKTALPGPFERSNDSRRANGDETTNG